MLAVTIVRPMSDENLGWGGELWAAADLLTPMAIRVAATLRVADHIAAGTRTTTRWRRPSAPTRTRSAVCCATWSPPAC